jgi:hypothetical protein
VTRITDQQNGCDVPAVFLRRTMQVNVARLDRGHDSRANEFAAPSAAFIEGCSTARVGVPCPIRAACPTSHKKLADWRYRSREAFDGYADHHDWPQTHAFSITE